MSLASNLRATGWGRSSNVALWTRAQQEPQKRISSATTNQVHSFPIQQVLFKYVLTLFALYCIIPNSSRSNSFHLSLPQILRPPKTTSPTTCSSPRQSLQPSQAPQTSIAFVKMITDNELYSLAIFLGVVAMFMIVIYHYLEVNAIEDTPSTSKPEIQKTSVKTSGAVH